MNHLHSELKTAILALLATLAIASIGCAEAPISPIQRIGVAHYDRMEATPVVWTDGRVLDVVSDRMGQGLGLEIKDGSTLIARHDVGLGLPSAMVSGGRLYIFGSTPWWTGEANELRMFWSDDLVTLQGPVTILRAEGATRFFNSSVTPTDDGFVMALETCEAGTVCFNARFFKSDDLTTWSPIGSVYSPQRYAACPTIRKIDGVFYVFYLAEVAGTYQTHVTRSRDLISFEEGRRPVLAPGLNDQGNTSDFDFIEHGGGLEIRFAVGSQVARPDAFVNIIRARYPGTQSQFVSEFF